MVKKLCQDMFKFNYYTQFETKNEEISINKTFIFVILLFIEGYLISILQIEVPYLWVDIYKLLMYKLFR